MMGVIDDAIHNRVAEVHIRRCHIYLGSEHARAFGKLAGIHAHEEVQIFLGRARPIGALRARYGGSALLLSYLL